MINKILVPTDFSKVAENALQYALKVAEKCGASLHILHVKQVPMIDATYPADTYQLYAAELEQVESEAREKMESTLLKGSPVKYEFYSIMGFVADEVIRHANENSIDLVIMGTTGASGLAEILVGSNAASVIGKTVIPVLIIPPGHSYKPVTNILYSTDYNEPEFPAVSRMMYFAELYDAKVTVLHVKTEFDRYFNSESNFFARNKEQFVNHHINIINAESGDVIEIIDKHIDDMKIDMLVMAKHNRGFFDRLFHRSLSKKMAYHSKVPLLVVNK
jgi:nucleotide-binding universal stress UspA family protein